VIERITVNVARTPGEAEMQARTGAAVAGMDADRAEEDEQALEELLETEAEVGAEAMLSRTPVGG